MASSRLLPGNVAVTVPGASERTKPADRATMPGTSSAPSQKCEAPGTRSSVTVPPASARDRANPVLWLAGTSASLSPCISSTGGAPACTWLTGLAARASSGTSDGGAPRNCASRDSGSSSPGSCMVVRSVTGNQATTPSTGAAVSAASSARCPPAESPHSASGPRVIPYPGSAVRAQVTAARTSSTAAG